MSVRGIDYLYFETRDLASAVEFWEALGFTVTLDLGSAARLDPAEGAGVFLQTVAPERPLANGVYLRVDDASYRPPPTVTVVDGPTVSHWGSTLITVRDPDGREFVLQAPGEDAG